MARRARSRISPSEPARNRLPDAFAQGVEIDPLPSAEALLAQAAFDGLALDGAKEEAVEEHVQHAAVLLGLGQRGRERLAEILARGPADRIQCAEGVEQLGRPHGHTLAAQLVGELEQPGRHARRAVHFGHSAVEIRLGHASKIDCVAQISGGLAGRRAEIVPPKTFARR